MRDEDLSSISIVDLKTLQDAIEDAHREFHGMFPLWRDTSRRFPPPWRADKIPGGYVIRGANGQALNLRVLPRQRSRSSAGQDDSDGHSGTETDNRASRALLTLRLRTLPFSVPAAGRQVHKVSRQTDLVGDLFRYPLGYSPKNS
jgi:hypothetical protein